MKNATAPTISDSVIGLISSDIVLNRLTCLHVTFTLGGVELENTLAGSDVFLRSRLSFRAVSESRLESSGVFKLCLRVLSWLLMKCRMTKYITLYKFRQWYTIPRIQETARLLRYTTLDTHMCYILNLLHLYFLVKSILGYWSLTAS